MLPDAPIIRIPEGTNFTLYAAIMDASDPPVGVSAGSVTSLSWKMWEIDSGSDAVLIAETGLTPVATYIPSTGVFKIEVTPAMNVRNNTALKQEHHAVRITAVSGGKTYKGFTLFAVTKDPTP